MLIGIAVRSFRILRDVRLGVTAKALTDLHNHQADLASTQGPPLRSLAVLVGDNRSGKSSLLEAIAFLRDAVLYGAAQATAMGRREGLDDLVTQGLGEDFRMELCFITKDRRTIYSYQAIIGRKETQVCFTGEKLMALPVTEKIHQALDLDEDETKTRTFSASGTWDILLDTRAACEDPSSDPAEESLLRSKDFREEEPAAAWLFEYLSNIFVLRPAREDSNGYVDFKKRTRDFDKASSEEPELALDGSNVREWLSYWRTNDEPFYRQLSEKIKTILHVDHKGSISQWLGRLTSAEVNLCMILILLSTRMNKSLICLENPDAGLFPDKVDALTREMREYSLHHPDSQLLMTTMHMNLLESMAPEEVWAFTLNGQQNTRGDHQADEEGIPKVRVRSAAEDPLIVAMYKEGIGLGTLLYGGYFA